MTTLDIVKLIEKSAITRLSLDYEGKLLNKIKNNFTNSNQQLFVSSFYCFLNYNTKTDFVIDFDNVWKWLGFSRKDPAKRLLEKYFVIDIDYKITKPAPPIGGAGLEAEVASINLGGSGLNKEIIMLSVVTFKKFSLKSGTQKADEVHDYYIKLEELLQETVNEQTNELRKQLDQTNNTLADTQKELKILTKKYIKPKKEVIDEKNVIYLMTTDDGEKVGEYVVGKSTNLTNRKEDYNHNKLHDFEIIYYRACKNSKLMDILEGIVLTKLGKYRCKAGRDVFLLPDSNNVILFTNIFDECLNFFEDVGENDVIYPTRTGEKMSKEYKKEYSDKYQADHKDELIEKRKEFYQNNKEELSIIAKDYREKNSELLADKSKKYYLENKDVMIEKATEYYQTHKAEILEDRKEFYVENKEKILEKRSDYYKDNYKTKISEHRQRKEICECGMTVSHYCMKKHKNTERHKLLMKKTVVIST